MLFQVGILVILPALVLSAPVIQLPVGRVQGTDKLAQDSQKPYVAFYGIPFAEPPVNELRFKPPQPFVGTGPDVVISSDNFRPACLQNFSAGAKNLSEDCLYLNVFTPPDVSTPKKVMFWIHGGAFILGDATQYIPSQLVTDKDVIVVTIHYRLGLLGFLTSENGDANNGLRDQILALKWTKDNIQAFGGDPNDITIFGESAGSASVSFLALSPWTKGMFTKAILQSGTALSGWAINRNPLGLLNSVAEKLGCTASLFYLGWFRRIRSSDLINCIRNKTVAELQAVINQTPVTDGLLNTDTQFVPVIDGDVIPLSPESLLANTTYLRLNGVLDRNYLVGVTNNEGLIISSQFPTQALISNFTAAESAEGFIRRISNLISPTSPIEPCKLELLYYQYSQPRDENGHTSLQNLLDIAADTMFVVPTVQFVRALRKASSSTKIFLYLFDHYPQPLQPNGPFTGSGHGLDVTFEFDYNEFAQLVRYYAEPPKPSETNLTELFRTALTQFAKTGIPEGPSGQEPQNWHPYNPKDEHYYRFSLTPKVDQHIFAKRVALWTDIVLQSNKRVSYPRRGHGRY
ncbi:hypothetical protein BsWGS_26023 [Bradybaena similaris]